MASDELQTIGYAGEYYQDPEKLPAYVLERVAVLMLMPVPPVRGLLGRTHEGEPLEIPGIGIRTPVNHRMPYLGDIYWIDDAGHESG
jgi:hypothetical protein